MIYVMPPRHAKTATVSERFPVYCLKKHSDWRVIGGSYAQSLANRISRRARKIAEGELNLSRDRDAVEEWETIEGGGYRAVGVGAGITGHGANLIIIDDPVKSREQADSPVYREKVWDWWKEDLYTRLEPGGRVIVVQTRWHTDDLCGRILAEDHGFRVVHFPAIATGSDWRETGAALWPDRFDEAALADIKNTIGSRAFSALYQGSPIPEEGAMFRREWFRISSALPTNIVRMVRYWDLAATEARKGKDPDYTVGALLGLGADGRVWILDVRRMRGSPQAVKALVMQTANSDGRDVEIVIEQEPGSSGKIVVDDFRRALIGFSARGNRETGDKVSRARPVASQAEIGNVWLIEAAWTKEYLDEMEAFPYGAHDDQVDGTSGAFNRLVRAAAVSFTGMESAGDVGARPCPAYFEQEDETDFDDDPASFEALTL